MKYGYKVFFCCVIIVTLVGACNIYNPPEPIPAYISIPAITLTTTAGQGTNSHKITDAWVYIDDQLSGCYELPCKLPVISEGSHEIKVRPGIKLNGISGTRAPYPYYTAYITTLNLQAGSVTTLNPTVGYVSYANFEFMEDFEGMGIQIDSSAGSTSVIKQVNNPNYAFEGVGGGFAYVDNGTKNFFECISSQAYTLPTGSHDVFLEFNYKADGEFLVGVIAQPPYYLKTSSLTYNASTDWNKTYLYLTTAMNSTPNATQFKIFFGMQNSTGADSLGLLLDNIKLIY